MNMFKMIRKELREHRKSDDLIKINEINYKKGKNNILLSAPHAFEHERNGQIKIKDYFTYSLIRIISQLSNCHVIYTNKPVSYDPNYDKAENFYYEELKKYVLEYNIEYVIDLHGLEQNDEVDLDIGTNNYKNINDDKDLIKEIINVFKRKGITKVSVDKFYASKYNTITSNINRELGVKSLQFEIGFKYRDVQHKLKRDNVVVMINALLDVINYIEKRNKFKLISHKDAFSKKKDVKTSYVKEIRREGTFDYTQRFDKILSIKPSFGYKRKLPSVINYDQVGLEIEVAVKLERDKYSFTRMLLKNIKSLIGKRGYFVKDGTIVADYGFEIVLDPLSIEEIYEIITTLHQITHFSKGLISVSKENNCGIHMNFNKYDIINVPEAHKRLTSLLSEQDNFFEANIYKQFKFIWDYEEYYKFQTNVSNKYVWVNYLDKKLVEVRNVKTSLSATELIILIKNILDALYYDKVEGKTFNYQSFTTLNKIYDTAFDKLESNKAFDSIIEDGFVLISLKDKSAKVINLDNEFKEEIKKRI